MRISYTLKTLIYVILTSTAFNMLAQSTQAFRHITLNRLNGLKHDNRNVFLGSDSQGYLWIGSNNGAYRYDGQSFTRYFVGDPRFNNTVKSQFFEDNKGIVWYGTPSGLVSFDTKDFQVKSYPLRTSFASQFGYHLIRRDSLTSSWFASNGTELLAIEESESNPKHLAQSKGVRHLLLKTEGSLMGLSFPWLLKQGLERVYQESKTGQLKISESKDKTIQSATINGGIQFTDSTAWLTSNIGLIGYNFLKDSSFIVSSFPDQKSAQRIWAAAVYDSLLLIATDQNGLWWFDPIKRKYIGELKSNSPKLTDQPRAIHVSNSGEILISRATGGVDVLIPQKFSIELLLASDSTDDNPIQVLSTEDSTAWILTTKGSLYKFQNNVLERKFDLGIKATERRNCHFTIDPTSNNFIISYGSSLISLDSSTWKIRSKTNVTPLTISNIFSIDSSILVTTDTSIYNYSDGKITPIDITNLNSPAFIKCTPLSKGRIAINKGGSNLYITTVPKAKLVVIDTITFRGEFMSILQREPSDKILLGTSEGLFQAKQNNELSRWIIDTPALTNRFIQKIASRNDSIIWVRTSNGLGRLRSQKWDWIFHEKELENLPNYSKGLAILKDEGVLLSSKQGLFAIRSSNSDREAEERIVVSQYWKDGILQKPIAEISDTVLSTIRTAQDFQFSFSTVGIYSSEPIRIRYRVIGASTGWRVVGEDRVLRLEQLPVGRHILEVQGLTLDQITTKPLHITIDIHIPYWETRWFRGLLLLTLPVLVGGVSFWIYRKKINTASLEHAKQLLLSNERDRIARDLHDQLGSNLSTILFLSEDSKSTKDDKSKISRLSREALSKMREVVWTLSDESTTLEEWINSLLEHTTDRCLLHNINFQSTVDIPTSIANLDLTQSITHNLTLLMREALENAIRHGKPQSIELEIKSDPIGNCAFSLKDDGYGFDTKKVREGLGISNLHFRANQLGARLSIESKPSAGTQIQVVMLLA